MPLMHGASIDYLEEVEADSLARALEDEGVTGMVGVPALWQLLERKIYKNVSDAGVLVEKAFDVDRSISTARCATSCRGTSAPASCCSSRCTASSAAGCGCSISRRLGAAARHDEDVPRPRLQPLRGLRHDRVVAGAHGDAARRQARSRARSAGAARHRRPDRPARRERRRRGDREGPERDGRLLRERRGDRADDRQTAGCTPATSAGSTRTATCSSSAARRR